jgi:transposase-like protein
VRAVEDLRVSCVREGNFHPRILPYRKGASLDLSEIILVLYAVGISTRKISHFLRVHAFEIKLDGRRKILGFWLFGAEVESAWISSC